MSGLQFIVENGWVLTEGLASIDRCELAMDAGTPQEVETAKRLLNRLAANMGGGVVSTMAIFGYLLKATNESWVFPSTR